MKRSDSSRHTLGHYRDTLKVGIGFHHRPTEAPGQNEFALVIAAGTALAHYWGVGSIEGQNVESATKYQELLDLSDEDVASLAEQARTLHAGGDRRAQQLGCHEHWL